MKSPVKRKAKEWKPAPWTKDENLIIAKAVCLWLNKIGAAKSKALLKKHSCLPRTRSGKGK